MKFFNFIFFVIFYTFFINQIDSAQLSVDYICENMTRNYYDFTNTNETICSQRTFSSLGYWLYFGKDIKMNEGPLNDTNLVTCPINNSDCLKLSNNMWTPTIQPTNSSPEIRNLLLCSGSIFNNKCVFDCTRNISALYCSKYQSIAYLFTTNFTDCQQRKCYGLQKASTNNTTLSNSSTQKNNSTITTRQNRITSTEKIDLSKIANLTVLTNTSTNELYLKCSIICANCTKQTNLNGFVNWYSNNNLISANKSLIFDESKSEFYSVIYENIWSPYINQEISCGVTTSINNSSNAFYSSNFYIGIQCQVETNNKNQISSSTNDKVVVTLNEGSLSGVALKCIPTIPVLCNDKNKDCELQLWLNYIDLNKYNRVVIKQCFELPNGKINCNGCNQSFKKSAGSILQDNLVKWHLSVNMESKNFNYMDEYYDLVILSNKLSPNLKTIWNNLSLPNITVNFKSFNRPLYIDASCFNDPHCKTFDQQQFEFHRDGEYLMFENVELETRVHLISKLCSPAATSKSMQPYCVNKIYMQSMHEIINIDAETKALFYTNLKANQYNVPIIFKNNIVQNTLDQLIINKNTYSFEITTNYGTTLIVNCYTWGEQLYMYGFQLKPSKADFGKTSGIFGNWNNVYDDLIYLRGTNTLASNLDQYLESFNSLTQSGLPKFSQGEYYSFNSDKTKEQHNFCECLKTNPFDSTIFCPPGLNQDLFNKKNNKNNKRNTKEHDFLQIDELQNSSGIKSFIENSQIKHFHPIKKRQVIDACAILLQNDMLIKCNQSGIIDLTTMYTLCTLDYTLLPDTDWAPGYIETAKSSCKFVLSSDATFFVTDSNGQKRVQVELLRGLCVNNCSNKGYCSDSGICICNTNFKGSDCSIDITNLPQIYKTFYLNQMYDMSNSSLKDAVLSIDKFIEDENSRIKCTIMVSDMYKNLVEVESVYLVYYVINTNTVYVNLTELAAKIDKGFYFLKFTASNNNQDYGNSTILTVYNSRSYSCSNLVCDPITVKSSSGELKIDTNLMKIICAYFVILFKFY